MAKGNIILGRLRKSVGDLTFRRVDGEQIVSAKAKTVKNPKSLNQRVQRAIFATASQLASSLYPVVNHSFEGETRTNGSLRAFRKEAIADLRQFYSDGDGSLCLNPKNSATPQPNLILVSKGRLGLLDVEYFSTGDKFRPGGPVKGMTDAKAITLAQFKNALHIDVKGGDEIAIVTMVNSRGIISAQLNRVVLVNNISDTDVVLNSDYTGTLGFSPMVIQADKTVSNLQTMLEQATAGQEGYGELNVTINANFTTLVAAAVVVSHYDTERGMWTYTSSRMGVDANYFAAYDNDAAIASYGVAAATAPASEYFLDQSNAGSSIASMPGSVFAQMHSGDSLHSEIVEGAIGEDITLEWTDQNEADLLSLNLTFPSTSLPQAWSVKNGDTEIAHSTANPSTSTQIGIDLEALTLPVTLTLELLYNTRGSDGSIQPITTTQTITVPGAAT